MLINLNLGHHYIGALAKLRCLSLLFAPRFPDKPNSFPVNFREGFGQKAARMLDLLIISYSIAGPILRFPRIFPCNDRAVMAALVESGFAIQIEMPA
jgi:hypothetical protein